MNSPGGIILAPGHAPWCEWQEQPGCCTCDHGRAKPTPPHSAREKYPTVTCRLCGRWQLLGYIGADEIAKHGLCFTYDFYRRILEEEPDTTVVVTRHARFPNQVRQVYTFFTEQPWVQTGRPQWLGFGGRPWEIHFTDGRVVHTNNLSHRGEVPEVLWHRFPVNARFYWRHVALVKL